MPDASSVVTLRNGATAPDVLVRTTSLTLRAMFQDVAGVIMLYELREACRDASHVMWGDTAQDLRAYGLVDTVKDDGTVTIHGSVRDIVLSSLEGEELETRLVWPVVT